jgi:hypothetical protein
MLPRTVLTPFANISHIFFTISRASSPTLDPLPKLSCDLWDLSLHANAQYRYEPVR